MQSIIVEVFVPATSASYDFRLPSTGKIGDVVAQVVQILESTEQNLLIDRGQPLLCDCERGVILKQDDTVAEAELRDGARLMLV